ncbi:UNVERIFIED_CONTAM: putative ribonuclease H protein, partial [Sesamum latifolium]
ENFCPHCPFETETVLHVLRDCTKAKTIWRESTHFTFTQQPPEDILTWLKTNCLNQTAHTKKIPWNTLFTFTCWHLWLQRNNHIYKRKKMSENWTLPQSLPKLPNTISYHHLPQQFANDASKWSNGNRYTLDGWIKLDTDGSSKGNSGPGGTGGWME